MSKRPVVQMTPLEKHEKRVLDQLARDLRYARASKLGWRVMAAYCAMAARVLETAGVR